MTTVTEQRAVTAEPGAVECAYLMGMVVMLRAQVGDTVARFAESDARAPGADQ